MIGAGRAVRSAIAVMGALGILLACALIWAWSGRDPYGGAFTGPCRVVTDAQGRITARLQLTDHGPPVEVGRIAVGFADRGGSRLGVTRTNVDPAGHDVNVDHLETRTFSVAAPSGTTTCEFVDWASAEATTWGGHGAGN